MKIDKRLWILITIFVLVGMILIFTKGFHIGLVYSKSQTINLILDKEFAAEDIKDIAKEVLKDKKFMIQKTDIIEESVNITAETITEEEKQEIIAKVNEKYELELDVANVETAQNANLRLRDLAKPYFLPSLIAVFIVLAVTEIKYRKRGILKVLAMMLLAIATCILIVSSAFAIFRIPINQASISIGIICEIATVIWMDRKIEKMAKIQKLPV